MRLIKSLFTAAIGFTPLLSAAQSTCHRGAFQSHVEVREEKITLADLLTRDTCPPLLAAAERVSLGAAPHAGSVRVFTGDQIRRQVEALAVGALREPMAGIPIPERIAVRRGITIMSCAGIARFLADESSLRTVAGETTRSENRMDCAGARGVPADALLELTKSGWNPALQRWEFALRCTRPEQCIPFLVWRSGEANASGRPDGMKSATASASSAGASIGFARGGDIGRLVKPGQTVTLSWDGGGIRIVLPVTCLDGGGAGELVRVRFKNTSRILQAEVLGDGTLRARL